MIPIPEYVPDRKDEPGDAECRREAITRRENRRREKEEQEEEIDRDEGRRQKEK